MNLIPVSYTHLDVYKRQEQVPVLNMADEPIGLVRSSDLMRAMIQ